MKSINQSFISITISNSTDQNLALHLLKAYGYQVNSYDYSIVSAITWTITSVKERLFRTAAGTLTPTTGLCSVVLVLITAATDWNFVVYSLEAHNR